MQGLKVIERKKANTVEKEYKLANRQGALEMLGRHLNVFDEKPKTEVDKLDKLLTQFDARNERNIATFGKPDGSGEPSGGESNG